MFVCDDCHEDDCPGEWIELIGPRSGGRCESCGKGAACIDCHGYKARPLTRPATDLRGGA